LREDNSEELLVQRTLNQQYTVLQNPNSTILMSEERYHLFRASYGISASGIDFSTYKFRRQFSSSTSLLCRTIAPIQLIPLKSPPSSPNFILSLLSSSSSSSSSTILTFTLQTSLYSFTLPHTEDFSWLIKRNATPDALSRELGEIARNIKIVETSKEEFEIREQELEEEGSWEESIESGHQKEVLCPDELLKARYPEVQMKILKANESEE
jgi:hypothetical protein